MAALPISLIHRLIKIMTAPQACTLSPTRQLRPARLSTRDLQFSLNTFRQTEMWRGRQQRSSNDTLGTRCHSPHAFAKDCLRQYGCGGRAVAGNIAGIRGYFPHHLRTHVLHRIFEIYLLRHSHAVFSDCRAAIFLVQYDIAPFRTECDLLLCRRVYSRRAKLQHGIVRQALFALPLALLSLVTVYAGFRCLKRLSARTTTAATSSRWIRLVVTKPP